MKILKNLGDNKYEVEIEPYEKVKGLRENQFGMVHDYVYFSGPFNLKNADNSQSNINTHCSFQIPIRQFIKFILPKIQNHEYAQEKHLEDKEQYEDDPYWNSDFNKELRLKGPRWKKGDKYVNYAWDNVATYFRENKELKVAILMAGEKEPTIMSAKFFDEVKDKIDWIKRH